MRTLVTLESKRSQSYNPEYHHKLRGSIWDRIEGTNYEKYHGERKETPFVFSNPFPVRNIEKGERMKFLVSSVHDDLIKTFVDEISIGEEFNIGERRYEVKDTTIFAVDVGEPGSKGTLETSSGVYIPLHKENWSEYNIDPPYNADQIGWSNKYDFDIFLERVADNIAWKQDINYGSYLDDPNPFEIFDSFNYQKGYSVDTKVTSEGSGYEYTFIVSKWKFGYNVRNNDHRRWLNILLNCGIGWRNTLGFGFVNKVIDNE